MRRTQRIIKPPSYLGYNSDSQRTVSNTSGFEVEDWLISQDNNDRVNVTPTSNGRTGLTQAMQDLQIEDVIPETDPNLESHDEDIMMEAFGASLDKSTSLDHSIWTERLVKSVILCVTLLPKRLVDVCCQKDYILCLMVTLVGSTWTSWHMNWSFFLPLLIPLQKEFWWWFLFCHKEIQWSKHQKTFEHLLDGALKTERKQIRQVVGGSSEMWQKETSKSR